jgi:molybdopterin/thiamine biosynthesis adenylyltransferase
MNRNELYKRIPEIFRPEGLRQKKAIVIGAGSGGGRVATELGRLGLPLILIDLLGEKMEEHNIVRHELGYASLGKPKTAELRNHIHNFNPEVPIECLEMDVTAQKEEFRSLVARERPDLLLACTDNQPSKHVINEVAVRFGIPVVGAGVYDGGIGGGVYITRPGAACYGCLALHLQLDQGKTRKDLNIDYNDLNLPEIRSTAALNLDIAQIALIHARVALNLLLVGETDLLGLPPQVNLIVFANRLVPGHFERPLHAEFFHIERQPGCLVCGSPDLTIEAEADAIVRSLAQGN